MHVDGSFAGEDDLAGDARGARPPGKQRGDRDLPQELPSLRQPLVLRSGELGEVVEESDETHAEEAEEREHSLRGERLSAESEALVEGEDPVVRHDVSSRHRHPHHDATHRRCAALVAVPCDLLLDELADVACPQHMHCDGREQDADDEGDGARDEQ